MPFLDLGRSHAPILDDVIEDVREILESSGFVGGTRVEAFEHAFAATAALALRRSGQRPRRSAARAPALGIGPGAEVLVPAMTFVATVEAVTQVGATPVPVDVSERDYCLDPDAAAAAVGPRTRALLPVHLYGQMADMPAIASTRRKRRVAIVEDACQAHGASRDGVAPVELGDAAAFSFYPGKNLGAVGDAGSARYGRRGSWRARPGPPRARAGAEVPATTTIGWTADSTPSRRLPSHKLRASRLER